MKQVKKVTSFMCTIVMLFSMAYVPRASAADALTEITPISDMSEWVETYSKDVINLDWDSEIHLDGVSLSEDYVVTFDVKAGNDLYPHDAYSNAWEHIRIGTGGGDFVWLGLGAGYIKYAHGYKDWVTCDADYSYDSFDIDGEKNDSKYWNVYMSKQSGLFTFAVREVTIDAEGNKTPAANWQGFTQIAGTEESCLGFFGGSQASKCSNIKVYKSLNTYNQVLNAVEVKQLQHSVWPFSSAVADGDFVMTFDYNWASTTDVESYSYASFMIGGQSFAIFPWGNAVRHYEGEIGDWDKCKTTLDWSLPAYTDDTKTTPNVYTFKVQKNGSTITLAYKPKGAATWTANHDFAAVTGDSCLTFKTFCTRADFTEINFWSKKVPVSVIPDFSDYTKVYENTGAVSLPQSPDAFEGIIPKGNYAMTFKIKFDEACTGEDVWQYAQISVGNDTLRFLPGKQKINYMTTDNSETYNWTQFDKQFEYAFDFTDSTVCTTTMYGVYIQRIGNTLFWAINKNGSAVYYDSFTMDVTTDRNNGTLLLDKNSIATTVSDIAVYSLSDVKAVLDENGDISVNGSFYSSETSEENYMVVLAEYNENGALISVMLFETNNTITVGTNKISFTVTASEGTHIVRPFVWTQDLFPLCNSEETIIIKNVDSND